MQQATSDAKNVIVIGKTGAGKSYFLNMLIQENSPAEGKFKVYESLESGTHECQVEENKQIKYGSTNNTQTVTLNIIDTPGLFDTKDDPNIQYNNQLEPVSIQTLKKIQNTVNQKPFQNQFNRVILVLSSEQKFDVQHKGLVDICKIMIGQQLKVLVVITKCQNLYEKDSEIKEIIDSLNNFISRWKAKLHSFQIEDVFFFSRLSLSKLQNRFDEVNQFYFDQWMRLYDNLKKSEKSQINTWDTLSLDEKQMIGKFFNYRIGQTEEQKDAEYKIAQQQLNEKLQKQAQAQRQEQQKHQLNYQKELSDIEYKARKEIEQLKQENERILSQYQNRLESSLYVKEQMLNRIMEQKLGQIESQMEWEFERKQRELQNKTIEQPQQQQIEQQITEQEIMYLVYTKSLGRAYCLSLDIQIDGIDNKLQYNQLFNNKVNVQGFNKTNICLGLTHLSKIIECNFIKLTFQYEQKQNYIELTNLHLIFCTNKNQFIRAEDININDKLLYNIRQNKYIDVQIINIQYIKKIGYYCPLTNTGEIFANGILISCYISPYEFPISQQFAQFLAKPLILYRQLTMRYIKDNQNQQEKHQPQQYLAPFAKIVSKILGVDL